MTEIKGHWFRWFRNAWRLSELPDADIAAEKLLRDVVPLLIERDHRVAAACGTSPEGHPIVLIVAIKERAMELNEWLKLEVLKNADS